MARVSIERGTAAKSPVHVASRSKGSRIEALLRNRAFIEDYVRARDAWREVAGWSGDCPGADPCVLTMNTAHTATANFVVITVKR
jgi:hypothetical protein